MEVFEEEIWKNIPGYEGRYIASNMGNLKSLKRLSVPDKNGRTRLIPETIIGRHVNSAGYKQTSFETENVIKGVRVHRLIALTFIPNPDKKPYINHINGIKTDNRVINLEWCTQMENVKHAMKHGLKKNARGEKQWKSKLTESKVFEIIRYNQLHPTVSHNKIAEIYNISRSTIWLLLNNKIWKHIPREAPIRKKVVKKHRCRNCGRTRQARFMCEFISLEHGVSVRELYPEKNHGPRQWECGDCNENTKYNKG